MIFSEQCSVCDGTDFLDVPRHSRAKWIKKYEAVMPRIFVATYALTNGKSASMRARLIARATDRWCFAHKPVRLRGRIRA